MIDIHSHIIPNIDDGAKSYDDAINILKSAKKNGVTDIILTPHFILGSKYNLRNKEKNTHFNELVEFVKKKKIDINLYLGNEIYYDHNIIELLDYKYIKSLNDSRYLLIELPIDSEVKSLYQVLFRLRNNGYQPIIAHPERYLYFQKNPKLIEELEELVLFQVNIGSFFGEYSKKAEKLVKLMLKHNCVHFIASDTHRTGSTYNKIDELKKILKKDLNDDEIEELLVKNPKSIIENKKIKKKEYIPFKKNIFGRWK